MQELAGKIDFLLMIAEYGLLNIVFDEMTYSNKKDT